jgi:S-sulfo-L-cysteine synthase (3-phospho-L-serine-dependent)
MTPDRLRDRIASYQPDLLRLDDRVFAAVFPLMKIIPAEFCVRQAMREGRLTPGGLVLESSSGTMALGLAIVCRWLDYPLAIVSDYACDDALCRRLVDLGARVERVSAPAATGGYQRARLDRLEEIRQAHPGAWWLNQYDNPHNGGAYGSVAATIVEAVGRVDCLVGAVGSGGSMCGTASYLRPLFPRMTVVGVDTFNSVLFGQPDGTRRLRGLGNSLLPKNLDHRLFDEVHWIGVAEAYAATRQLHQTTALFRGGTSGATWLAARDYARRHPDATVVCLFADDGNRYVDEIYDDARLKARDEWLPAPPGEPCVVDHPIAATGSWARFDWKRRAYEEVMQGRGIAAPAR